MGSRREGGLEKTPTAVVLARRALRATRDARAGSPPWRVPGRTSSCQTQAGAAVLLTLPAECRCGQLAPPGSCQCGAWANVSTAFPLIGGLGKTLSCGNKTGFLLIRSGTDKSVPLPKQRCGTSITAASGPRPKARPADRGRWEPSCLRHRLRRRPDRRWCRNRCRICRASRRPWRRAAR